MTACAGLNEASTFLGWTPCEERPTVSGALGHWCEAHWPGDEAEEDAVILREKVQMDAVDGDRWGEWRAEE